MKISELIEILAEQITLHGDKEIKLMGYDEVHGTFLYEPTHVGDYLGEPDVKVLT